MARRYPPEFRVRVLDLIASGRKVADVARDLGVSGQTIYNWRAQDLVDRGDAPGLRSAELAELVAPKRRITQLEAELAATKARQRAAERGGAPKGGSRPSRSWPGRATRRRSRAASWRSPSPGSTPNAAV
jgi:transposase